MRDLESAVNVRELNQSAIIKTFDSVSVSFFFILLADEHLIFYLGIPVRFQKAF